MLIEDKVTFKDFTESEEAIATNILSTKLKGRKPSAVNSVPHPTYKRAEKGDLDPCEDRST